MKISKEEFLGPSVHPQTMLRYLIRECDEIPEEGYLWFPFTFKFFGFAVLRPCPDLLADFDEIVLSEAQALEDACRDCKELFSHVLIESQPSSFDYSEKNNEQEALHSTIRWHFLRAAERDGEKMLARGNYEFISIFHMLGWVGLRSDAQLLEKFETSCLASEKPEEGVKKGLNIVRDSINQIHSIIVQIPSSKEK
jgi:hypothetical protein